MLNYINQHCLQLYKRFSFGFILIFGLFTIWSYNNNEIKSCSEPVLNPIPYKIFMTWDYKPLHPKMQEHVDIIQAENPEFELKVFDNIERRQFITKNFDTNVLDAYDRLIPGTYRADLWRFCVLYIYGGVYMDMDKKPVNGFRFKSLMDNKEYFVKDRESHGVKGVFTAFMITRPGNTILLKAINRIVYNVKNKVYGLNALSPTGPLLLRRFFTEDEVENFKYFLIPGYITSYDNSTAIIKDHGTPGMNLNLTHYHILYEQKNIYRD